jgi:protein-S-isoprenylcysteine O-methyltransferase Ste14
MGGRILARSVFVRAVGLAYAVVGYVATHVIFLILILFLMNLIACPRIDAAPSTGVAAAVAIDLALIALFGVQHTAMARAGVKRFACRLLPEGLERATYVHVSNLALAVLVFAWQPIPFGLWTVEGTVFRVAFWCVFVVGWGFALAGSLLIDPFQLLGLRQAWSWFEGDAYVVKPFQRHWLYEYLRHPIQFGLILAFWATPAMSVGHLLFAAAMTVYIVVGTHFEEQDLIATFGDDYAAYRARVPGFIPRLRRRESNRPEGGGS